MGFSNSIYMNKRIGSWRHKCKPVRRKCECGHTVEFLSRKPRLCNHCYRWVYPDDKYEFEEKLKKEISKHE